MPLTYCLNVHPGETWDENLKTLRTTVLAVRDLVSPGKSFGLGMRLGAAAAETLGSPARLEEFREFLHSENLFVFTVNAFPYGKFHGGPVKENVYAPDWRTLERREFTTRVSAILALLLPEGQTGSISTVPLSWKEWIDSPDAISPMVEHLIACVAHCSAFAENNGREIQLALEPEPGCLLETTAETIAFFENHLFIYGAYLLEQKLSISHAAAEAIIRRHLGVCLDTCHVALQFEDPAESMRQYAAAGIKVPKIQISSALRTDASPAALEALRPFAEPIYLHQTKARRDDGTVLEWTDLPQALDALPNANAEEVRVHFHVPLHFTESGPLESTGALITNDFLSPLLADPHTHLEIETYTWDVLPPALRATTIEQSIAAEFAWVERASKTTQSPANDRS